jgi:hypothetical protein
MLMDLDAPLCSEPYINSYDSVLRIQYRLSRRDDAVMACEPWKSGDWES